MKLKLMLFTGSIGVLGATSAFAQESVGGEGAFEPSDDAVAEEAPVTDVPEAAPAPEPEPVAEASAPASTAPVFAPAPAPTPTPAPDVSEDAPIDGTDHAQVVGRVGVGYLGWQTVRRGQSMTAVQAPVVGVRYWASETVGLDLGLGIGYGGGSTVDEQSSGAGVTTTTTTDAGAFAMILHAGVPLSLATGNHFSFQLVPEMNLGIAAQGDSNEDPNIETTETGFHFGVGARVGGEIQFGFMGIPELALQASVGLAFRMDSGSSTTKVLNPASELTDSRTTFGVGTTVDGTPWDIFASNISALYYF